MQEEEDLGYSHFSDESAHEAKGKSAESTSDKIRAATVSWKIPPMDETMVMDEASILAEEIVNFSFKGTKSLALQACRHILFHRSAGSRVASQKELDQIFVTLECLRDSLGLAQGDLDLQYLFRECLEPKFDDLVEDEANMDLSVEDVVAKESD